MNKKILQGKELKRFRQIQHQLWYFDTRVSMLKNELKDMGLEFDIMGKPENFVIKKENQPLSNLSFLKELRE